MPKHKFPIQRLPNDLCLKVLNTMEHHEIMAFSFTSKKSHSMVKHLCLPVHHVKLAFPNEITVLFDRVNYSFYLKWHENDNQIRTLNDIPTSVDIYGNRSQRLNWSNQGKTIDELIQHFCSVSQSEIHRELKNIAIHCSGEEPNENISSSETVLRAFLPDPKRLVLYGLPPNRSIGSIRMTNLDVLSVYRDDGSPYNLKLEDLLSLNVTTFNTIVNEFSLRDLNRFFKMWIKGSNAKLEDLEIYGHSSRFPDWDVLLNGFKAVEEDEDEPQEGRPKEAEAVTEEEPEEARRRTRRR